MTNYLLPSILVATVLLAGAFALMPVDEAKAVHTTIQGTQMTQAIIDSTADLGAASIVCDSDAAFVVMVMIGGAETDGDNITILDSVSTNTITVTGALFTSADAGAIGFGNGYSATISAPAASTITVGGTGVDDALVSLITTSGATADCTDGI